MPVYSEPHPVLNRPKAVDVAQIEHELKQLWQVVHSETSHTVKACTLNLIVFVPSEMSIGDFNAQVSDLTTHTPCRVIILIEGPRAAPPSLNAWISARCVPKENSQRNLCWEQITILGTGDLAEEMHSAAAPLLIHDLPVALWWRGDMDFERKMFQRLADSSYCVILNSAHFRNPDEALVKLADLAISKEHRTAFRDINWLRMSDWRQLTAQLFDSPEANPQLKGIHRVTVEFGSSKPEHGLNPAQALYTVGWLASRLNWKLKPGGNRPDGRQIGATFEGDNGLIEALITPSTRQAGRHETLFAITLESSQPLSARFRISRNTNQDQAEARIEFQGRRPLRHTVPMKSPDDALLVSRELSIRAGDLVFDQALQVAAEILRANRQPILKGA